MDLFNEIQDLLDEPQRRRNKTDMLLSETLDVDHTSCFGAHTTLACSNASLESGPITRVVSVAVM